MIVSLVGVTSQIFRLIFISCEEPEIFHPMVTFYMMFDLLFWASCSGVLLYYENWQNLLLCYFGTGLLSIRLSWGYFNSYLKNKLILWDLNQSLFVDSSINCRPLSQNDSKEDFFCHIFWHIQSRIVYIHLLLEYYHRKDDIFWPFKDEEQVYFEK